MDLYAKITCDISRDPKMIACGPLARLLYIQAVLYARENLTDGHIDRLVLPLVAVDIPTPGKHMGRLVDVRALNATDAGWQIPEHAWKRWNPTKDDVEEMRSMKREAGERGNHERWHTATGKRDPKCRICVAESSQERRTVRNGSETGGNRKRSPETETETETELLTPQPPYEHSDVRAQPRPPTPLRGAS